MPLDKGGDGCWYGAPVRLPDIRKWDHEDPALYEVTLTLRDAGGAVQETVPYKTGFRRFGMDQGVMKLNGGADRFQRGEPPRVESRDRARHRPRGYVPGHGDFPPQQHQCGAHLPTIPDQTLWYHLCDENGIYMIDEANLESHGSWQKMGRVDPAWNVPGSLPEMAGLRGGPGPLDV